MPPRNYGLAYFDDVRPVIDMFVKVFRHIFHSPLASSERYRKISTYSAKTMQIEIPQ